MTTDLVVGQKLLFVREDRLAISYQRGRNETIDQATELTVERLGRKWARCGSYRVHRYTLDVDGDGYGSPGRCYLSREHYAAEKAADRAWRALSTKLLHRPDNGPSAEAIRQAAALLGVEIPDV
jgi:hypothetical protein